MSAIRQLKSRISVLLVLAYLLIGTGVGHGMVLCQESADSAHLEYNLTGSCQDVCLPLSSGLTCREQLSSPAPKLASDENCIDHELSHFHTRSPSPPKLLDHSAAPLRTTYSPALAHKVPTAYVPVLTKVEILPPRQDLIALRTVVLLH